MKRLLIENGTVITSKGVLPEGTGIYVEEGKIVTVGEVAERAWPDVVRLDAGGLVVAPGFIDTHVHLRDPGFPEKETIYTGTRACAKGGYTTVACMPNTRPALDAAETLRALQAVVARDGVIDVYPVGAITKGILGEQLSDHEALFESGAVGLSDDGRTTMNPEYMRAAFRSAHRRDRPVMTHSEDHKLTAAYTQERFPVRAESDIIKRDIDLCEAEGAWLHVQHVSSKEALEAIKEGRRRGVRITCEAAPHHFALSDARVDVTLPMSKVNPPIRSEADRQAIVQGILEGHMDVIATDHAPHEATSKQCDYSAASFGISGIESAFTVAYTTLVLASGLPLERLIGLLTWQPARILGLEGRGDIREGYMADLVFLDLQTEVVIDPETFISMGKNTPFKGYRGRGDVVMTLKAGESVYRRPADANR